MKTTNKSKVELIDSMGSDLTVVNAAKVSFDKESEWEVTGSGTGEVPNPHLSDKDTKLINYLAKYNHWSPFAHTSIQLRVTAPIFVARQLVKHCVTGDTEVSFCKPVKNKSNGVRRKTIADLYNMWKGNVKYQGGAKGKRNVTSGHVKVYNELTHEFESSHITDVLYQGVKQVFEITTDSGQVLKITADHKVMTQRGWIEVRNLEIGVDKLITEIGKGQPVLIKRKRHNDSDDVIARRELPKEVCNKCGATGSLEADHIIPVYKGGKHTKDNMQVLCSACHKEKSKFEKLNGNTYQPRYTTVVDIVYLGTEDVYDISVNGLHNFLANGLVIHNCVGGVWNEVSRRYVNYEPEFYFPVGWRGKPINAKQGSDGLVVNQWDQTEISMMATQYALDAYNTLLGNGVAPEQARAVLPQNAMTSWYWTGSLVFFHRVFKQRTDPHAQVETAEVGHAIGEICEKLFPHSWSALCNTSSDC